MQEEEEGRPLLATGAAGSSTAAAAAGKGSPPPAGCTPPPTYAQYTNNSGGGSKQQRPQGQAGNSGSGGVGELFATAGSGALSRSGSGVMTRALASIGESLHQAQLLHRHTTKPEDVVLVPGFKGPTPMLASMVAAAAARDSRDGSLRGVACKEEGSARRGGGVQMAAARGGQHPLAPAGDSGWVKDEGSRVERGARRSTGGGRIARTRETDATKPKALATSLYWWGAAVPFCAINLCGQEFGSHFIHLAHSAPHHHNVGWSSM